MKRREFIAAGEAALLTAACGPRAALPLPPGALLGPRDAGHRLRDGGLPRERNAAPVDRDRRRGHRRA
ncbi:MAG: hypothetical protein U1F45_17305 [Burkholderiales bacterium]